jgi:hypothetical protein
MTRNSRLLATWGLAMFGLALLGCDSPTSPVNPVRLTVPPEIAPGATAQLSATFADSGVVRDVTGQARWVSSNPGVIEVSPAGIATALARGEAGIFVTFEGRTAVAGTMVLPRGTFRLAGDVRGGLQPPSAQARLAGVQITVTEGSAAGLTTTTDDQGRYALYGVSGDTTIQYSADGYNPGSCRTWVAGHGGELRVRLWSASTAANLCLAPVGEPQ